MSWCNKRSGFVFLVAVSAFANPYPDPNQVPKDAPYPFHRVPKQEVLNAESLRAAAPEVLRVLVDWNPVGEVYSLSHFKIEKTGTDAFVKRSLRRDPYGSYQAQISDPFTGKVLAYDSVGTGQEFRRLVRSLSFRFPNPGRDVEFLLVAENPSSGIMETVLKQRISAYDASAYDAKKTLNVEVRSIHTASVKPGLVLNLYAEGYAENRREKFFKDAQRVGDALHSNRFPLAERFEIQAVFAPSNERLGPATNLGSPVPVRDTFLGLYFPYWDNFGRWFNVVYPTSERKYREGLAEVPYDYPLAIVDDSKYWGVGNYNELTAIPNENAAFTYLLLHEFGHFFGLNEEYESGGRTELEFADGIKEPWSQNITFLPEGNKVKWASFISSSTPIPTPHSHWKGSGTYGAYRGGYADSPPVGKSHKPGKSCIMSSGKSFCPICTDAISKKIRFDLGE